MEPIDWVMTGFVIAYLVVGYLIVRRYERRG